MIHDWAVRVSLGDYLSNSSQCRLSHFVVKQVLRRPEINRSGGRLLFSMQRLSVLGIAIHRQYGPVCAQVCEVGL